MMNAPLDITNVCLETKRLFLRPWREDDLNDFYEYAKVDGVGQMAGWNPHTSIEESKDILTSFMKGKNVFAIECKENHKAIGSIGLHECDINLGDGFEDLRGREIGYVINKDYWGKGLTPEAVKQVIQYCLKEKKYDFLLCCHYIENNQSKRVIEKCGFEFLKEENRAGINGTMHVARFYVLMNKEK